MSSEGDVEGLEIIGCPEVGCIAPAEVVHRVALQSTEFPGVTWMIRLRCVNGHWLFMPEDMLDE